MGRLRRTDITGEKFGKLTVIQRNGYTTDKDGKRTSLWLCKCECGNKITVPQHNLVTGGRKSCGCLRNKLHDTYTTHNLSRSRIYHTYNNMLTRCYAKKDKHYDSYGGRGIKVCDEWKSDFMSFYKWAIKNGYNDSLTIDRIDVNGNYEPNNCRWVNAEIQNRNKRNNVRYNVYGESLLIREISEKYNIPIPTLRGRMKKFNISMEEAIEYKKPLKTYTYHGETKTFSEWSEITGISKATLLYRAKQGYTEDEIFIPAIVGYHGRRNKNKGGK